MAGIAAPATGQDLRTSTFAGFKAGLLSPATDLALTEGLSILFGLSPNVLLDASLSYYEVNKAMTYVGSGLAASGKEVEVVMRRYELSLAGSAKYFLSRIGPSSIRPFLGGGLGVHYGKGETYLDGDVDSSLKAEYKLEKSRTTVSLDPVGGLATFWTSDLLLFAEVRYMLVVGEQYNETSLSSGFAVRL